MAYKVKNKKKFARAIFIFILLIAAVIFLIVKCGKGAYSLPPDKPARAEDVSFEIDHSVRASNEYLLLVNKTHPLSSDYWPSDMVNVSDCIAGVGTAETKQLRKVAADALANLFRAAGAAGYEIEMRTGFRSYDYQKNLFASYAKNNGEAKANKYSAKAGQSEHQSGLCCDVSSPSVDWQLSYEYGNTAEGKWLAEHAHEYGFIIRYPEGKEDITGYVYEPWHIRYVGVSAATRIREQNITLEEYLGEVD